MLNLTQCPCGSSLRTGECCGAPTHAPPPGPKTGYAHPGCYARALTDCSRRISAEHVISSAVLNLFSSELFEVSGAAWLEPGLSARLTVGSLKSNILCERHNSALSGLDIVAHDFFGFLMSYDGTHRAALVPGLDVERWLVKVLCGSLSSRHHSHMGHPMPRVEPPLYMLGTLFDGDPLPEGWGLAYVLMDEDREPTLQVAKRPLIAESSKVVGLDLRAWYIRLLLALQPVETFMPTEDLRFGLCLHPSHITV